jgi:transposase
MFIERIKSKYKNKTYEQILLRETFREKNSQRSKVKHRTLLNITKKSKKDIEAIELGLKCKNNLDILRAVVSKEVTLKQGRSVGAVWLLYQLAKNLGIPGALGQSKEAKLALWMVLARLIDQGSRLSAVRLAEEHAACEILDLPGFTEDDLYKTMDWLDSNQAQIEKRLFKSRKTNDTPQLFLYDVTSSYLEGNQNEYATYGYNRDKKSGKQQIVIGLLTDYRGIPLSVEVFEGNTQDSQTVSSQIRKMAERFGAKSVTMVGDRGMIKKAQIEELTNEPFHFHYLTAITKPQIEKMIKSGHIQLGLFDSEVCEVSVGEERYILRKNPYRAEQIKHSRSDKFAALSHFVDKKNEYLSLHPRAKTETAAGNILKYAEKLRIDKLIRLEVVNRTVYIEWDEMKLEQASCLDGCYVLKTDVPKVEIPDAATLHDRYKDLTFVEKAFRTMKTSHLEIRPVYVRKKSRTSAHAFTVMLAYILLMRLEEVWRDFDFTVEEGIKILSMLCAHEVELDDDEGFLSVAQPRESIRLLFEACDISPPTILPKRQVIVATRKKLQDKRIS